MELIAETDEYYLGRAPSGSSRNEFSTYREPGNSPVARAVRTYLEQEVERRGDVPAGNTAGAFVWENTRHEHLELTVHGCWSGYSEFTISNTWDEITVKWGPYELMFDSMSELFRALADAEEKAA